MHNARDLGGLPIAGGGTTRWGAVVRADSLDRLTSAGWAALEEHGVRTVIDLRNDDETEYGGAPRPAGLTPVRLPHDAIEEAAFWADWVHDWQTSSPLYYAAHLARFPERSARVVVAVAQAPPGGVAVHCRDGRDRTGLIAVLLLALAEVEKAEILADYALSDERMAASWAAEGYGGYAADIAASLERENTSAAQLLSALIDEVDLEARLRDGGLADADLAALRERFVE